jgi:pimeloyl-ACP methyl ester carboxylesterase
MRPTSRPISTRTSSTRAWPTTCAGTSLQSSGPRRVSLRAPTGFRSRAANRSRTSGSRPSRLPREPLTKSAEPRLAYTETGAGRPVVLLHGLTCSSAFWLRVVPLLDGLRAISLDFGGHGLSGHRDSYGYADYERDLSWLLDELGHERATVAGHSLGGYVALLAATKTDRIASVLAIDVKSDWTDADAELADRSRDSAQRVEPERATLVDRLARTIPPVAADELDVLVERSVEQVDGGWRFRWDRRVLATEPVDPFAFLGDVACAVTVMAGAESDVMPPTAAERFAEAIPGATLELVDGAGHHVELESPDRVARAILGPI